MQKVEEFNRQQESAAYSKALSGIVAQGGQNVMVIEDNDTPVPLATEPIVQQAVPINAEDPERPVETVHELPVADYTSEAVAGAEVPVEADVQDLDAAHEKKKKR